MAECSELRFSFIGSKKAEIIKALSSEPLWLSLRFDSPAYNVEEQKFEDKVLVSGRCNIAQRKKVRKVASNVRFEDLNKGVITSTADSLQVRFLEFQESLK